MVAEDHSGTLKVVASYAQGLRLGKDGRKPNVVASIRMLAKKQSSQPVSTTQKPENVGTTDPTWDQTFVLDVADLSNSQMEVTLWDMSEVNPKNNSNFLGEVLLNVAKLEPFSGQDVQQLFAVRAGTTIPVEGEVSGKLFLTLRYSSAHGGAAGVKPIGVTLHMEKAWEEIKPQKYVFEKDLLEDLKKLLPATDARVEVVGTERGKGERLSHETATLQPHFLAHINIHPSTDKNDTRSPNDLVAILREMMEKKKQGISSPYQTVGLLRDLDVHEPYRKIDPATQATKTPATRAVQPQPVPEPAPKPTPQPQAAPKAPAVKASAPTKPSVSLASMMAVGGTLSVTVAELAHLPKMDLMGKCDPVVKLSLAGQEKQTTPKKGVYDCDWKEELPLVFPIAPIQSERDLLLKVTVVDWDKFTKQDVVGTAEVNILALLHPSAPCSEQLQNQPLLDPKKLTPLLGHDKLPTVFSLSSSWTPNPKPAPPPPAATRALVVPDPTPTPPPPVPKPTPPAAVVKPTPQPPAPEPPRPAYKYTPPAQPPYTPPAPAAPPVVKPAAVAPVVQAPPPQPQVAMYSGANIVMDVKKDIAQARSRMQGEAAEAKRRTEQEEERVAIAAEEEQKRALAQLSQLPRLTPATQTTLATEQAMQTRASISSVRNLMLPSERTDAYRVKQEADVSIRNAAAARANCENARNSMAEMLQQARMNAMKGGGGMLGGMGGREGAGGMGGDVAAQFSIKLRLEASQLPDKNAFFEDIKMDLANAVGVDPRRFQVVAFGEVGFLVLDLSLASAPNSNAAQVVEQLRRQSFELESPLQRGQHTSKILAFTVPQ